MLKIGNESMRVTLMSFTKTFMELKGGFCEKCYSSYFCTSSWMARGHSTTFAGFQLCCYDISARAGWATLVSVHRPIVVVLLIGHSRRRQQHSWDGSGGAQFVKFQNEQEQVVSIQTTSDYVRVAPGNTLSHSECSPFPETIHVTTCKSKVKTFGPLCWSLGPPFCTAQAAWTALAEASTEKVCPVESRSVSSLSVGDFVCWSLVRSIEPYTQIQCLQSALSLGRQDMETACILTTAQWLCVCGWVGTYERRSKSLWHPILLKNS